MRDGIADSTFGINGLVSIYMDTAGSAGNNLEIQYDGKIVICGYFQILFSIQLSPGEIITVTIKNLLGNQVQQSYFNSQLPAVSISLSNLTKGFYCLNIRNGINSISAKFCLQ